MDHAELKEMSKSLCLSVHLGVHVCNISYCSEHYLIIQLLAPFPKQILEFSCPFFWLDNQFIQAYVEQYSIILQYYLYGNGRIFTLHIIPYTKLKAFTPKLFSTQESCGSWCSGGHGSTLLPKHWSL